MLPKTVMLGMLEARPTLHEQLRRRRLLLAAIEAGAAALTIRHAAASRALATRWPASDPAQLGTEALEIVLQEMAEALPDALPPSVAGLPAEQVMGYFQALLPHG